MFFSMKNMTRFAFAAVALLSLGCSAVADTENFSVSSDFSDAELTVMQEQADILCAKTDGVYCAQLSRGSSPSQIVLVSELDDPKAIGRASVYLEGDSRTKALIQITKKAMAKNELRRVVRHELGHVAGCRGHIAKGNVMSTRVTDQPADWTPEDIKCVLRPQ